MSVLSYGWSGLQLEKVGPSFSSYTVVSWRNALKTNNKLTAHFQKEWQTGARMGSRSIMGSFGGAFARAKTFSLTQVKFQFIRAWLN